jgi:hypothetical protein
MSFVSMLGINVLYDVNMSTYILSHFTATVRNFKYITRNVTKFNSYISHAMVKDLDTQKFPKTLNDVMNRNSDFLSSTKTNVISLNHMYEANSTHGDILSTENNMSGKFLGKPHWSNS